MRRRKNPPCFTIPDDLLLVMAAHAFRFARIDSLRHYQGGASPDRYEERYEQELLENFLGYRVHASLRGRGKTPFVAPEQREATPTER